MDKPTPGFQQRLGLFDSAMLVAGAMIGSGIFIVSADIARDVGSSGWLLAVWAIAGLMTVLGALAYAELAAMMPQAGGQYIYLREAFGPLPGFLYGWTSFTVIQTGTIAAVGVAFAKFAGVFVPALGARDSSMSFDTDPAVIWGIHFSHPLVIQLPLPWLKESLVVFKREEFTVLYGQVLAVVVILSLTAWNTFGVQQGKWLQNIFTVAKIGALAVLIIIGLTITWNSHAVERNFAHLWQGIEATERSNELRKTMPVGPELLAWMIVGGALVGALFSADAWHNVAFTAGEVRNPRRNLPLSLILGTGLVIALYLLANVAYLVSLPLHGTKGTATVFEQGISQAGNGNDRVGTALMSLAFPSHPKLGAWLMAIAIMISTFGCMNGLILMGARLYYAMARDGLFFAGVGTLNRHGVPAVGLWTLSIWSCLLVFSGTYSELLDYVIFAAVLFYGLTVTGLFVLRLRQPNAERPYRALGYPILPGLYVVLCAAVMFDLLLVKPIYTWPGLLLVIAGIPVYLLWRAINKQVTPQGSKTRPAA
ncbi:MAG TPA: amino acid permease [Gemmataceae bacterium]|nr:amino acid permease [Gemmataceae bacterium]